MKEVKKITKSPEKEERTKCLLIEGENTFSFLMIETKKGCSRRTVENEFGLIYQGKHSCYVKNDGNFKPPKPKNLKI
jgi:hypothetical protein